MLSVQLILCFIAFVSASRLLRRELQGADTGCDDDNDGAGTYLDVMYATQTYLIVGAYGNIDNCIVAAAADDTFCDTESNAVMCCETCTILKAGAYSKDYVDAKRMITQNNWYTEVFTVTAEELDDFIANVAPKYWSETSQVIIPVAGTYTGPEEITEYYLLQNGDFTMGRHYLDPLEPCSGDFVYTSDETTMNTENPGYALYGLINGHLYGGCDPTIEGTVNSYTYDDANSVFPNTVIHNFDESSVLFTIGLYGTNEELCTELMERCDGENQQYDSMEDCLEYHEDMKQTDQESGCPLLSGHTTACHWTHMYLSGLRPEVHCYHSGKEVVDPNGKLACSMEQCTVASEVNVENCQAAFDPLSQSFSLAGCCWEDNHCFDGESCSRGDPEDPGVCETVDSSFAPTVTPTENPSKRPSRSPSSSPIIAPTASPIEVALTNSAPTKSPALAEEDFSLFVKFYETKLTCLNAGQKLTQPCNGGRGTGCSYEKCTQHCFSEPECNFFFPYYPQIWMYSLQKLRRNQNCSLLWNDRRSHAGLNSLS